MDNENRLIYSKEALRMIENSQADNPWLWTGLAYIWNAAHESAISCVNACNTVEAAEVVHGEWIDGYSLDCNGKKHYESIDCSVCEEIFKIESHDREYWKRRFKTCPFCSAKMDGGLTDGK